jgi:hypothetical protein
MHTAAHNDPLYRYFAEMAREEAGPEVYAYCASCHAPVGIASRLVPATADAELPPEVTAGVSCDICHQISQLTGESGPWHQPGNASFVLQPGRVRFGSNGEVTANRLHTGEKRDFFAKSEFCASCHTVIHPTNGLAIEHTYDEWKASEYARRGIQCQDCHMASVEDAIQVAQTLKPIVQLGQSANEGPQRRIRPHWFVGASVDADRLADGPQHAKMAVARLKSAARLELVAPPAVAGGGELKFEVMVHNVAAGHNLPTGVTELRQIWVELRVADARDQTVYHSGRLDEHGELPPGTIWFGATAVDAEGKPTYKPWEMTRFTYQRTIPPRRAERETIKVKLPEAVSGPVTIEAKLFYRSVPPSIAAQAISTQPAFSPTVTEMARAHGMVRVSPAR